MSDKIAVTLELTEREAIALRSLLLRGADWHQSGQFGKTIEAIYYSLSDLLPPTPNYYPHQPPPRYIYPIWKEI